MNQKDITPTVVEAFLGIDEELNVTEDRLQLAVDILTDLVNGDYTVKMLHDDVSKWQESFEVINDPDLPEPRPAMRVLTRPAPMPPMSPFGN
mgnify:CR=1 FL=1